MTKRLVVGRDDVSAWGTALSFKQGSKSVVVTNGSGWNDYKSEKKISDTAVNLAMTRVDVLPNQIEKMERHDHTQETLCPTDHPIVLGVCAKEFEIPVAAECVLLEIPCGTSLVMDKGTWHSPCFGLRKSTQYYWIATSDPRFPSEWVSLAGGGLETRAETESNNNVF